MPVCTTTDHSHCYVIMIQCNIEWTGLKTTAVHWLVVSLSHHWYGGCWSTSSHALITLLFSGVTLPDERALQFCSSFHRCLVQPGNAGPIQLHTLKPTILLWQMPQHCNVYICDQMGIQLTAQMKKRYGTCEK